MNRKFLLLCNLVVLALAATAFGVEPKREIYVIQSKPASVAVVDTEQGTVTIRIPLEKNPTHAIADSQGRFLYVVHDGGLPNKPKPGRLSVVDLEKRAVTRLIPLGAGVTRMQFSGDEQRLFCFARGKVMQKRIKLKPGEEASITVIDTSTHEVKVVHRLDKLAEDFVMTRDGSRVFAFSSGKQMPSTGDAVKAGLSMGILMGKAMPKSVNQEMTIFGETAERPPVTIPLQSHLESIAFSRDEKLLYLLGQDRSGKATVPGKGGILQALEVESGKIIRTETVNEDSQRLIRLSDEPGLWLAGKEEMRFLSEDGALAQEKIALGKNSEGAELDGYPGETILLPGRKVAALITKKNGAPTNRLAVIDLEKRQVDRIVPVGRASVRAGKVAARIGLAVGLSALSYGAFSAVGSPSFYAFYPTFGHSHNENLARRDDGKYFYALNSASNDVTVVQSSDGAVTSHIPVDSTHYRLWMPKDSKYLFCLGGGDLNILDTGTNQKHAEHKLAAGALVDQEIDDPTARLYLLTRKELEIWDGQAGERIKAITGLEKPLLLVRRNQITP